MIVKYPAPGENETCAQCRRKIKPNQQMLTHLNGANVSPNIYRVYWHASCVQAIIDKGVDLDPPTSQPVVPKRGFDEVRAEVVREFAAGRLTP